MFLLYLSLILTPLTVTCYYCFANMCFCCCFDVAEVRGRAKRKCRMQGRKENAE